MKDLSHFVVVNIDWSHQVPSSGNCNVCTNTTESCNDVYRPLQVLQLPNEKADLSTLPNDLSSLLLGRLVGDVVFRTNQFAGEAAK